MNERDPYRDPAQDNPAPPHRNPDIRDPVAEPAPLNRRPLASRSASPPWGWIFAGAAVVVALAAFFMMAQPTVVSDVPATGTIPQTERPVTGTGTGDNLPAAPIAPGGPAGAPALDAPLAPPAGAPPGGAQPN